MKENQNGDEFGPYQGQIVKAYTQGHEKPLFGRIVEISDKFLTFDRRDGRKVLVSRDSVITIEPAPAQQKEAI
jgi:hypothetical protein